MTRSRALLFAALVALPWAAASARADTGEAPPRPITLQEAVAGASDVPDLVAARAAEAGAGAAVRVARSLADVEVSVVTNSINARESASLLVPLPWPARGPRVGAATAGVATAARSREEALASARLALRAAWFALAAAEDRSAAAIDRDARARRNADAVAALFGEGRVARLEKVRSDAEAALSASERLSAAEGARASGAALATLLGLPPGTRLATAGPRPGPEPEPSLEETVTQARAEAPEVRVQAAAAAEAEARYRLARRLRSPAFGLSLGAEWNDPTQEGTNSFAGVTLAVPIAGSASAAVAAAERDRQQALLEQARRAAAVAADAAWGATRAARLRFEAIEHDVLPAARQSAELTRLAYHEGKVDVFRLLDAERLLTESEAARADSYEAWGAAHAELLRVTSRDAP